MRSHNPPKVFVQSSDKISMKSLKDYVSLQPNSVRGGRERLEQLRIIQDRFHLRVSDWTCSSEMHPEIRKMIGQLYSRRTATDNMLASIIRGVYSYKQSVFLLSARTAIDLLNSNPEIPSTLKVQSTYNTLERDTFGRVRDRLESLGVWSSFYTRHGSPRIYKITDNLILRDIGRSTDEWVKSVFENMNVKYSVGAL